jgi:hypothetical protein
MSYQTVILDAKTSHSEVTVNSYASEIILVFNLFNLLTQASKKERVDARAAYVSQLT